MKQLWLERASGSTSSSKWSMYTIGSQSSIPKMLTTRASCYLRTFDNSTNIQWPLQSNTRDRTDSLKLKITPAALNHLELPHKCQSTKLRQYQQPRIHSQALIAHDKVRTLSSTAKSSFNHKKEIHASRKWGVQRTSPAYQLKTHTSSTDSYRQPSLARGKRLSVGSTRLTCRWTQRKLQWWSTNRRGALHRFKKHEFSSLHQIDECKVLEVRRQSPLPE